MKHIVFYLDFISPYAYLAFEQLPLALQGLSYRVTYKPVFLGALLKHHGTLGPAEVPAKRQWMLRQVQWLARQQGVVLDMPAGHPFNSLPHLRLAVSTQTEGTPNRWVCERLLRHVWTGGADAADPQRLELLAQQLPRIHPTDSQTAKDLLRAHTDEALAHAVFGVPTWRVGTEVFWGVDALPMLRAHLETAMEHGAA